MVANSFLCNFDGEAKKSDRGNFSNLFSSHILAWACVLHLKLSDYGCFLNISVTSQQISIHLVLLFTLYMLYNYSNIQSYSIT